MIRERNLVSFNPSLQGTSTNFGHLEDWIKSTTLPFLSMLTSCIWQFPGGNVLFPLPNLRLNPICRNLSILLLQPKSMAQTFPHFHQKSITNQALCKSSQPSICSPRCWCLTFCKFCTSAILPYPMAAMPSMDLEP